MRHSIWLIVIAAVALLLWLIWSHVYSLASLAPAPKSPTKATDGESPKEDSSAAPSNLPQQSLARPDQQNNARIVETRSILKGANRPVNFWGQVLDQDNTPVPGVQVKLSLKHTRELFPGAIKDIADTIKLTTDAQGMFRLANRRGSLLGVEELKKPGYEANNQNGRPFWYAPPMKSMLYTPDKTKPEIFRMWKLAGAEELLVKGIGTGIPYDDTPVFFDLFKGSQVASGGDIKVTLKRTPLQIIPNQRYDWVASIEAIDGGVIASMEEFMYRAPEGGYVPKITIMMRAEDPDWVANKYVFFYLKSRGKYARVTATFSTDYDRPITGFGMTAFINPSGSRNLEYNPLQGCGKP